MGIHGAPETGTLIAGKYRVDRVLASGGMGVVVVAEHAALGQRVAIKFLLPEAGEQPELVERFLREARAAAQLQSDHVVRVFDMGTDERGVPFMVMELLAGHDLGDEIEARGPLPVGEAVGYVVEALDAIVEAHAAGIVHRDLKPANLFLVTKADGSRRIKVLDFGISKFSPSAAQPDAALTSTKSMLGSPGYMSPEQVRSTKSVDARTDVWALGVILYEMLSGEPAFHGETLGDIFAKIREEDLPPIRDRRSEVPEGLGEVLGRCLQRDREKRIADAASLRRQLLPFAGPGAARTFALAPSMSRRDVAVAATAETIAVPSASDPGAAPPRPGGETLATWSGERRGRRRSRLLVGGALALCAAGGLGVWLVARPGPAVTLGGTPRPPVISAGHERDPRPLLGASTGGAPQTVGPAGSAGVGAGGIVSVTPQITPSAAAPAPPTASAVSTASAAPAIKLPRLPPSSAPTARPTAAPSTAPTTTRKKEDLGI